MGVEGDCDVVIPGKNFADDVIVEHLCQDTRVQFSGLAAAGATVEARRMRVVAGTATVTSENHHGCEIPGQGHRGEDSRGQLCLRCRIQFALVVAESVAAGFADAGVHRVLRISSDHRFAQQLEGVAQADRLHITESCRCSAKSPTSGRCD